MAKLPWAPPGRNTLTARTVLARGSARRRPPATVPGPGKKMEAVANRGQRSRRRSITACQRRSRSARTKRLPSLAGEELEQTLPPQTTSTRSSSSVTSWTSCEKLVAAEEARAQEVAELQTKLDAADQLREREVDDSMARLAERWPAARRHGRARARDDGARARGGDAGARGDWRRWDAGGHAEAQLNASGRRPPPRSRRRRGSRRRRWRGPRLGSRRTRTRVGARAARAARGGA